MLSGGCVEVCGGCVEGTWRVFDGCMQVIKREAVKKVSEKSLLDSKYFWTLNFWGP